MENFANKIADLIIGLILIIPLLISIFYILKFFFSGRSVKKELTYFESPFRSRLFNNITVRFLSVVGLIVSAYLVFNIIVVFWFSSYKLPFPWNVIGIVLFFLYWGGFGALYSIGVAAGHAGVTSLSIFRGLTNMISTKRDKD